MINSNIQLVLEFVICYAHLILKSEYLKINDIFINELNNAKYIMNIDYVYFNNEKY